ncbi:metal-dependent hydrolase [Rhodococcus sp. X156]|uniref:metal-dependent hydrolase n=1 Tax=Rhodococcus sp. X156 TaxID=2499145 RepID=UPI000FD9294D|nr:metal-dependent hydrolase [Rhodococcus sp. X156]
MGRTHVLSSTAIGLACAAPLARHVGEHPMPVATLLAFAAIVGGFGVLPDLDHPHATLARTLGPVTKALSRVVNNLSGGHRRGTHTVWMALLMVGLATTLATRFGRDALVPVVFVGYYLFAMILRLSPNHRSGKAELLYVVEAAAATAATYQLIEDWWWVPYAVGFGVIGHIVGDILTVDGVPILYPLLPRLVVRLPLLGRTDSALERSFATLLVPAIAWMAFALFFGQQWWDLDWLKSPPQTWQVAALH